MIRGVTRRVHALKSPALAFEHIAVAQAHIRHEVSVSPLFHCARVRNIATVRAEAIGWRIAVRFEQSASRRMIHMRVRD